MSLVVWLEILYVNSIIPLRFLSHKLINGDNMDPYSLHLSSCVGDTIRGSNNPRTRFHVFIYECFIIRLLEVHPSYQASDIAEITFAKHFDAYSLIHSLICLSVCLLLLFLLSRPCFPLGYFLLLVMATKEFHSL